MTPKSLRRNWLPYLAGACAVGVAAGLGCTVPALATTGGTTAGGRVIGVSIVPDAVSVQPTTIIGYTAP